MASKLADRIRYAMEHLSHKQHLTMLARPNWRRIQWKNVHALGSNVVSADSSENTPSENHQTHQRPGTSEKEVINPGVDPEDLPGDRLLLANMGYPSVNTNITETLWKVRNSRYRRYRYFCNARKQREMRRKQRITGRLRRVIKPEDWDRHLQFLDKLAAPKERPRPRFPFKRKRWRPVNMRRIEQLSVPSMKETPPPRDPFTIPTKALTYEITERLEEISKPKMLPEVPEIRIPGTVSPAALRAIASPRTIILAKPAERPEGMETDLRKDAFTVSPKALKAKCSRRLKFLARPKRR